MKTIYTDNQISRRASLRSGLSIITLVTAFISNMLLLSHEALSAPVAKAAVEEIGSIESSRNPKAVALSHITKVFVSNINAVDSSNHPTYSNVASITTYPVTIGSEAGAVSNNSGGPVLVPSGSGTTIVSTPTIAGGSIDGSFVPSQNQPTGNGGGVVIVSTPTIPGGSIDGGTVPNGYVLTNTGNNTGSNGSNGPSTGTNSGTIPNKPFFLGSNNIENQINRIKIEIMSAADEAFKKANYEGGDDEDLNLSSSDTQSEKEEIEITSSGIKISKKNAAGNSPSELAELMPAAGTDFSNSNNNIRTAMNFLESSKALRK